MDKKTSLILGVIFLITGGLIFTIERLSSYVYWFAQTVTGDFPSDPEMLSLFDNLFIPFFFLIAVISFIIFFKKK